MAIELDFDLRGEERHVRERIADVYKRLPSGKQKQIKDPQRWLERHLQKWREGKRSGEWFDQYLKRAWSVDNRYPELTLAMGEAKAGVQQDLWFLLGGQIQRLQRVNELKGSVDGCWASALQGIEEGRSFGDIGKELSEQLNELGDKAVRLGISQRREMAEREAARAKSVELMNESLKRPPSEW